MIKRRLQFTRAYMYRVHVWTCKRCITVDRYSRLRRVCDAKSSNQFNHGNDKY